MNKKTESRKAFEAKIKEDLLFTDEELVWQQERNGYAIYGVHLAWWAWQKSQESLVVELPKRQAIYGYGDGYMVPSPSGEALEYDETVEAIRAIGIRIKGEGV